MIRQKFIQLFLNNFVINCIIRLAGLEALIYHQLNPYIKLVPSENKSTQENAGYSNRPEINEVLEKSKSDLLQVADLYCKKNEAILDIGCGPGMYLQQFKEKNYQLTGTDLNPNMINLCKKNVPEALYCIGDFMSIEFKTPFKFIYCIGMLIYIPKYQIEHFIKKVYSLLDDKGIFYLNYPHAISLLDTWYNDLTYIRYSPQFIEKIIAPYFTIIKHEQAFDGRKIVNYDKQPYKSLNPATDRTYKNSYLLIAQKK